MADNKVTIGSEPITIPAAQFARMLTAAVHCDFLMEQKRIDEEKIARMRKELTRYQAICERRKTTSGAGASAEPHKTTTNAPGTITDAGMLAIGTEGRVSGGERAELEALRRERDELKAALNIANDTNSAQADQLRDALNALEQERMNKCDEVTAKRLAAAERCIEEIEEWIDCDGSRKMAGIIRAYREKKEASR